MADLTAKFQLIDEVSEKLAGIAEQGAEMLDRFDMAGQVMSGAFVTTETAATQTAHSIDSVAVSVENYNCSVEAAGGIADYWTEAVGNYDRSALEAVYTTEELVEMGLKVADAMEEQERMFELCEQSATSLNRAMDASTDIYGELEKAVSNAADVINEISDNERVSAETKEELTRASEAAAAAMRELEVAQTAAQQAMENYDAVMMSGTADLTELEAAAERACHASENLAEANGRATNAMEELSRATESAAEESEEAGDSGVGAVEGIATALAAAGITATIKEIVEAVYELVDAFSEGESIVAKATGATGAHLDNLSASMMKVYAMVDDGDLNSTAGAIGEINTRLGLQGEELEEVAGLFMQYADNTNSNVVTSVQNVTKVMNKWGVEADDIGSVLDKLTYAGQISGASVDSLSGTLISGAASFQEMGLSLDNAISMLCDFELYGMNSTAAITAMRTAVKNFTGDGLDAGEALQSVINEIANMESQAEATALAVETFGSRAGIDMVNGIRSGAITVDTLTGSLDEVIGTLDKTDEAADTLADRWTVASNSMKAAFTSAVEPTLTKLSSGFADLATGAGKFLNEHPVVTKAITAVGVGLGVLAVGISGVAFVTTVAIPAVTAFGTALNASLGPIGWVSLAITGVVAAGTALAAMFSETIDVTENMTMSTRSQYYKLQDLNEEYERACNMYGETSEQAGELALQVSKLEDEYNTTAETIGEFTARIEEMGEAIDSIYQTYKEAVSTAEDLYSGSISLASQLLVLSDQSDITGATLDTMSGIVDKLNANYDDLGLTIDETTGKLNFSLPDLYEYISKAADEQKKAAAMDSLTGALMQFGELKEASLKASQDVAAAWDNYEALEEKWQGEHPILKNIAVGAEMNWSSELGTAFKEWEKSLEASSTASEEYNNLIDSVREFCEQLGYTGEETEVLINQLEKSSWAADEFAEQMDKTTESTVTWEEATTRAFSSVEEKVTELVEAYNASYEAARNCIDNQIGLFENMKNAVSDYAKENEVSMDNMLKSLQSQAEYLAEYNSNLEAAKELGITDALISELSDGSVESAAYLEAIVNSGEEKIAELNSAFEGVQEGKDQFATTVAEMETDFAEKMNGIEQKLQESIQEMNMSDEAATAAATTIEAYTNAINAQKSSAVSAAESVSSAVATALKGGSVSAPASTATVKGHALGTTNAEDVFVAGEDGPELIIDKGGSTVFPAEETEKILNAFQTPLNIIPKESKPSALNGGEVQTTEQTKHIKLEIAGSGEVEIRGGANEETILSVLQEKLKPVLMNIIRADIFEEGELSYGDY